MKKIDIQKRTDKKISIFSMGLNLELQPYWLIEQMLNDNSQKILDDIISQRFKKSLADFDKWEKEVIELIGDNDPEEVFDKHKREKHIQEIQDVADITRHLLPLHSDWESVATEEEQKILERAYSYWKYNKFYGFEGSAQESLEIKENE